MVLWAANIENIKPGLWASQPQEVGTAFSSSIFLLFGKFDTKLSHLWGGDCNCENTFIRLAWRHTCGTIFLTSHWGGVDMKSQAHCRWCLSQESGPDIHTSEGRASHKEQVHKQCPSMVSTLVPALSFFLILIRDCKLLEETVTFLHKLLLVMAFITAVKSKLKHWGILSISSPCPSRWQFYKHSTIGTVLEKVWVA